MEKDSLCEHVIFGRNGKERPGLMRGSFWHKDSLITHILFELQPIMIFSLVANFGDHSLVLNLALQLK